MVTPFSSPGNRHVSLRVERKLPLPCTLPLCINLGRYFPRHRVDRLSARVVVSIQRYMLRKLASVCFYPCPPLLHSQHVFSPPPPAPPFPVAGLTGCPSIEMPAAFTCHPQFSILHKETARLENNGPFPSSYFKLRGRKKDLVFITHKPDLRIKVITVQM